MSVNLNTGCVGNTFFSQSKLKDKATSQPLKVKDGMLYTDSKCKYTGIAKYTDKNNDDWEYSYLDGKITESRKNGIIIKSYKYSIDAGYPYFFKDGSRLDEKEFFHFSSPNVMTVTSGRKETTIYKYQEPQYRNQPILDIITKLDDKITKRLRVDKNDGTRKLEFNSLDEAKRHFKCEYGIRVKLDNLAQAHVVLDAVEGFMNLNVKSNIFKGLVIESVSEKTLMDIFDSNDFFDEFDEIDIEENEDNEEQEEFDDADNANIDIDELMEECPECNFIDDDDQYIPIGIYICSSAAKRYKKAKNKNKNKPHGSTIFLNKDFNWSSVTYTEKMKAERKSSYSSIKGHIQHELAHYLHSVYSPWYYFMDKHTPTHEENLIMSEVSSYSEDDTLEFVAEYITGRLEGNKYSNKINQLYKKFKGPDIFYD